LLSYGIISDSTHDHYNHYTIVSLPGYEIW